MPRANSNLKGERRDMAKKPNATRTHHVADPLEDAMAGMLYLTTNCEKSEVKVLARKANIDLSGFSSPMGPTFCDFSNSIKALVCMGLDTDDNLILMFGSTRSICNLQQEIRMGLLFGATQEMGTCSSTVATDPNKPASVDILRLLPCWQRSLTRSEKDDHCLICQETLFSPAQALHGCMHMFHVGCIRDWLTRKSTCPHCKKALPLHAPRPASLQELELIDRMSILTP